MIGTETNWLLNLEKPDLDYTFLCNTTVTTTTTRNDSNIIFAGNYLEKEPRYLFLFLDSHSEELDTMKFSGDGKYFAYKDQVIFLSSQLWPSLSLSLSLVRSPVCSLTGLRAVSLRQFT